MRIQFQQSGGVTGLVRPLVSIDTENLPGEEAARWHDLVAAADFFNLPSDSPPGARRDSFSFRISIDDGKRQHSVQAQSGSGSAALEELIGHLQRSASINMKKPTQS